MQSPHISYDLAKRLAAVGFDSRCHSYCRLSSSKEIIETAAGRFNYNALDGMYISCPTQDEVVNWLRERKELKISITETHGWNWWIYEKRAGFWSQILHSFNHPETYFKSQLSAIEAAVKFLEEKK